MATSSLSGSSVTNELIQNAVVSNEHSKEYINKLISTAIGFILHQRTDLDREDFKLLIHNDLVYYSFKEQVQHSDLREVCGWLEGAIDAFKRNYLKELYLIFTNMLNTKILEYYKFKFIYQEDNVVSDKLLLEQNLEAATDKLLFSISQFDMEKRKFIEFIPYIYLTYNDNAPADYEPPYFQNDYYKQRTNAMLEIFLQLGKDIKILGCMDTSFHLVECQCQIDESVLSSPDVSDVTTESIDDNLEDSYEESSSSDSNRSIPIVE